MYAYVGCRTTKERNARKGLKTYEISESTGEWKELQCLRKQNQTVVSDIDLEKKYLYSVHGYHKSKQL